jgi:hypothetical protein
MGYPILSNKVRNVRAVLFLLSILIGSFVYSNTANWSPYEQIYKDGDVKVEISFRLSGNSCEEGGSPHQFRYKITGLKRGLSDNFLNWKTNITDCERKQVVLINSVNIGPNGTEGIVESYEYYAISGMDLERRFYDAVLSQNPAIGAQVIGSSKSKLAESISGNKDLQRGDSTVLNINGGYLGYKAVWAWYANRCGGIKLGVGSVLTVSPLDTTTYYVRAEGRDTTNCIQITINVDHRSFAPDKIDGNTNVCKGGTSTLSVNGGSLGLGAGWVWYADSCNGKPIGVGSSIIVTPQKSSWYYVRAEGKYNITGCAKIFINVNERSENPLSISGARTICEGEKVILTLSGGKLAKDANWKWYSGICSGTPIATGASISFSPYVTTTYYVRGEGVCNTTQCISTTVNVNSRTTNPIIRDPGVVYKGKKTQLSISTGRLGHNAQWKWYKGECNKGSSIGTGNSITIKPKKEDWYYVKGEGDCNATNCDRVYVTLKKERKFTPQYGSNVFRKKSLHLGIGIGLDAMYYAVPAEKNEYNSSGSLTKTSLNDREITGLGLKAEFVIHPIMKEAISLGIITSYAAGTTPLLVVGNKVRKTDANSEKEKLFYSRFELGTELATGSKQIKFLAAYKNSMQRHQYERNITYTSSSQDIKYFKDLRKETISAGLRIGSYSRFSKRTYKKGISLDLTYNISRDYEWAWNNFIWRYNNATSNWQHGLGFALWVQSAVKIQMDVSLFKSQLGSVITPDYPGERSYYQLSVIYNRNAFY